MPVIIRCRSGRIADVGTEGVRDGFCTSSSETDEPSASCSLVTGRKTAQLSSRFFHASVKKWTRALDDSSFSADRLSTDEMSIRKSDTFSHDCLARGRERTHQAG